MPTYAGKLACECLVAWLPVFERALKTFGIAQGVTYYQLIGGAKASAGVHSTGGAFDIQILGPKGMALARNMGAADWDRPYNWDNAKGMAHNHGVLNGCPHLAQAGRNQITDLANGRNGLANHAADTGPEPRRLRTWQQGIEWAEAQMEDDMAIDIATIDKIAARVWLIGHNELGGNARDFLAGLPVRIWMVRHAALGGRTAFEALATTEAKVDAVIEAVKGIDGVDPDTITAAVREAIESISVTVKGASDE